MVEKKLENVELESIDWNDEFQTFVDNGGRGLTAEIVVPWEIYMVKRDWSECDAYSPSRLAKRIARSCARGTEANAYRAEHQAIFGARFVDNVNDVIVVELYKILSRSSESVFGED